MACWKELSDKFKITAVRTFASRKSDGKDISRCLAALDDEFNRVISYLYGGNDASRLLQQSSNLGSNEHDTVIISDDDDDGGEEVVAIVAGTSNSQARRTSVSMESNFNFKMNKFSHEHSTYDEWRNEANFHVFYFVWTFSLDIGRQVMEHRKQQPIQILVTITSHQMMSFALTEMIIKARKRRKGNWSYEDTKAASKTSNTNSEI